MYVDEQLIQDFIDAYSYAPVDNYRKPYLDDWRNWLEHKGYVKLNIYASYAVNSNDLDVIAEAAALLGFAPAFRHRKYTISDETIKSDCKKYSVSIIRKYLKSNIINEFNSFDELWKNYEPCAVTIHDYYSSKGLPSVTYGLCQKWINMSIKYFYVLIHLNKNKDIKNLENASFFDFAPFPVDDYMAYYLKLEKTNIHFDRDEYFGSIAWQNCNDLDIFYRYERDVLSKIKKLGYENLLSYEFINWPKANAMGADLKKKANGINKK